VRRERKSGSLKKKDKSERKSENKNTGRNKGKKKKNCTILVFGEKGAETKKREGDAGWREGWYRGKSLRL